MQLIGNVATTWIAVNKYGQDPCMLIRLVDGSTLEFSNPEHLKPGDTVLLEYNKKYGWYAITN